LEQTVTQQTSNYDKDLQMFREPPGPVNVARLRFLRWLVEHERLGHRAAGPPSGEFAEPPTTGTPVPDAD
jgi:hypothetical protein